MDSTKNTRNITEQLSQLRDLLIVIERSDDAPDVLYKIAIEKSQHITSLVEAWRAEADPAPVEIPAEYALWIDNDTEVCQPACDADEATDVIEVQQFAIEPTEAEVEEVLLDSVMPLQATDEQSTAEEKENIEEEEIIEEEENNLFAIPDAGDTTEPEFVLLHPVKLVINCTGESGGAKLKSGAFGSIPQNGIGICSMAAPNCNNFQNRMIQEFNMSLVAQARAAYTVESQALFREGKLRITAGHKHDTRRNPVVVQSHADHIAVILTAQDISLVLQDLKLLVIVDLPGDVLESLIVDTTPCGRDADEAFQSTIIHNINIRNTSEFIPAGSHHVSSSGDFRCNNALMVARDICTFADAIILGCCFLTVIHNDSLPNFKITPTAFIHHDCLDHFRCPVSTAS